jgi:hypothetical protein
VLTIAADPKHLGARIGITAVLHTCEREAELLPVPYFHVVFTLPARIAAIAYQNKAVVYDLLFKAGEQATYTHAQLIRMDNRFRARLVRAFKRGEESRASAAQAYVIPSRSLTELLAFPAPLW